MLLLGSKSKKKRLKKRLLLSVLFFRVSFLRESIERRRNPPFVVGEFALGHTCVCTCIITATTTRYNPGPLVKRRGHTHTHTHHRVSNTSSTTPCFFPLSLKWYNTSSSMYLVPRRLQWCRRRRREGGGRHLESLMTFILAKLFPWNASAYFSTSSLQFSKWFTPSRR